MKFEMDGNYINNYYSTNKINMQTSYFYSNTLYKYLLNCALNKFHKDLLYLRNYYQRIDNIYLWYLWYEKPLFNYIKHYFEKNLW
jgi:hypothetical protein